MILIFLYGCCSWDYSKEEFEFTEKEIDLLGPYKINDTIYFENSSGDLDTLAIVDIKEDRNEGSKCFIQTKPYHSISIVISHLPSRIHKWPSTVWSDKEQNKTVSYQNMISISKSPGDSNEGLAGYSVSYRDFTTSGNAFNKKPQSIIINNLNVENCYSVSHGYPERVINPSDIEFIYWTEKYGLTGYKNKSGETWLLKNL